MFNHRTLLAAGTALTAVAASSAPAAYAAPVEVKSASLNWSQTNHYGTTTATRAFLGHTTQPGLWSQGRSNGTVVPAEGATLAGPDGASLTQVGPTSPRGLGETYVFGFPKVSASWDPATKAVAVQTKGSITYNQYPELQPTPPAPIKINGLRVELSATGGAVYANVSGPAGAGDYPTTTTPLFRLNVANAQTLAVGNGRYVISGLVPTLGRGNVFGSPGQYAPGTSGPDRTPNTWGGFSLTLDTQDPAEPSVTVIEKVVEKQTTLEKLVEVDKTSQLSKVTLTRTPFSSESLVDVNVSEKGKSEVLGKGFVLGRKLWVVVPKGTTLKGEYTLRRTSGSKKLRKVKTVTISTASSSKKAAKK